jgi:hypothetical protein
MVANLAIKKKSLKKKKTHLYMDGCNFSCKNKFLTKCSCGTPKKMIMHKPPPIFQPSKINKKN